MCVHLFPCVYIYFLYAHVSVRPRFVPVCAQRRVLVPLSRGLRSHQLRGPTLGPWQSSRPGLSFPCWKCRLSPLFKEPTTLSKMFALPLMRCNKISTQAVRACGFTTFFPWIISSITLFWADSASQCFSAATVTSVCGFQHSCSAICVPKQHAEMIDCVRVQVIQIIATTSVSRLTT
jgi:hypothetical protein